MLKLQPCLCVMKYCKYIVVQQDVCKATGLQIESPHGRKIVDLHLAHASQRKSTVHFTMIGRSRLWAT